MGSKTGTLKIAAKRVGLTVDEYTARLSVGLRWCTGCKAWHCADAFGLDRTIADGRARTCLAHRKANYKANYVPRPATHYGPLPYPPRDGDKKQARQRVNVQVRTEKRPRPDSLPCVDCGHTGDDKRHEYDHYLGYAAEHHYDVEPVCSTCHHRREETRKQ